MTISLKPENLTEVCRFSYFCLWWGRGGSGCGGGEQGLQRRIEVVKEFWCKVNLYEMSNFSYFFIKLSLKNSP